LFERKKERKKKDRKKYKVTEWKIEINKLIRIETYRHKRNRVMNTHIKNMVLLLCLNDGKKGREVCVYVCVSVCVCVCVLGCVCVCVFVWEREKTDVSTNW
jgi:hypothetical protein